MRARLLALSPLAIACFSLLGLVTAVLYAQLLGFDFIRYDDRSVVVENQRVQGGLEGRSVASIRAVGQPFRIGSVEVQTPSSVERSAIRSASVWSPRYQ